MSCHNQPRLLLLMLLFCARASVSAQLVRVESFDAGGQLSRVRGRHLVTTTGRRGRRRRRRYFIVAGSLGSARALREEGPHGHSDGLATHSTRSHARGAFDTGDHMAAGQKHNAELLVVADFTDASVVYRPPLARLFRLLACRGSSGRTATTRSSSDRLLLFFLRLYKRSGLRTWAFATTWTWSSLVLLRLSNLVLTFTLLRLRRLDLLYATRQVHSHCLLKENTYINIFEPYDMV